jgi:hypothetical protein
MTRSEVALDISGQTINYQQESLGAAYRDRMEGHLGWRMNRVGDEDGRDHAFSFCCRGHYPIALPLAGGVHE